MSYNQDGNDFYQVFTTHNFAMVYFWAMHPLHPTVIYLTEPLPSTKLVLTLVIIILSSKFAGSGVLWGQEIGCNRHNLRQVHNYSSPPISWRKQIRLIFNSHRTDFDKGSRTLFGTLLYYSHHKCSKSLDFCRTLQTQQSGNRLLTKWQHCNINSPHRWRGGRRPSQEILLLCSGMYLSE